MTTMSKEATRKGKDEVVVFSIVKESACSECKRELGPGEFLRKEGEKVLCLACADLGHLVFLPRGNAGLTRRASQDSGLRVVVVRWSRTRKRYERQGVLVDEEALEQAEQECLADEEIRKARQEREAARRKELDWAFVEEFAGRIRVLYPGCPRGEERKIAEHACRKYSGRVGRSAAAKRFEPEAIDLAVRAYVRHRFTDYDTLLGLGYERFEARQQVAPMVEEILRRWSEPGK